MIRLTRAHTQPIGLDIGHDSIKMLQLEVVNDSLSVVAAARMTFGPEAQADPQLRMPLAADMIRQMLRQNPFIGRHVVAALPRDVVHIKNLRLPVMPAIDLQSAVEFEAKNIFTFDTETASVHHLPVGEVRQGVDTLQEVIVLAARHEDIDNFVDQVGRAGVLLDGLDAEPCALYRVVERFIRRREDEQEVYVLVDLGLRKTQVIIGKGRDITFHKPIDVGGLQLNEAVGRKLGISVAEAQALRRRLIETPEIEGPDKKDPVRQTVFDATRSVLEGLAREVSLCLRYHSVTFRGHRPARVRLYGGEACDPQVQAVFNGILSVSAEPGRPLYSVNTSRMRAADRRGTMCEWAMAMALGLKRTAGRFGARDGKPRDPNAPRTDLPAIEPDARAVAPAAQDAAAGRKEVAHA